MENSSDNNDEDTLELASKTWNRVIDSASKTGYREGIKDGSTSVFQDGFDKGYKEAFKATFFIGVYKGFASCLTKDLKHPEEIDNILSKTKRGICYLCEIESKESSVSSEKSITEIESCQKEHSDKIFKILQNYFNPLLKEHNFNVDILNFYTT